MAAASTRFALDSHLMPLPSPVTTETIASAVMPAIRRTCTSEEESTTPRVSRPALICSTPKPSDVATPNSVPTTATTSTRSPTRPRTRSPNNGSSAQRMETGRPRRWTAYAMDSPTTT